MRFFGESGEIHCPDGSTKYIETDFKKLPQIFAQYFPEVSLKFNTGLQFSKEMAELNAGTSFEKSARQIYEGYDAINAWAYNRFIAAYYVYKADPCKYDDYLSREVQKVNDLLDRAALSELERRLEFLKVAPKPSPFSVSGSDPRLELASEVENILDTVIEKLSI